jgi:hypothetical protein
MRRGVWRRDEEGVASSIGTMLAVLVILALLTIVSTSWAPEWTKEKEAEHMRQVEAQFSNMKALMDQLILSDNAETVVSTPLTLGSQGTPLFAGDAKGTVSLLSTQADGYNTFTVVNSTGKLERVAYGSIMYGSENSEYLDQSFIYECGAIIVHQNDGELVTTGPALIIQNNSGKLSIAITLISVYSDGSSYTGSGTVGVQCRLVKGTIATTRSWDPSETIRMNVTTKAYEAWYEYFAKFIPSSGVGAGDYDISVDESSQTVRVVLRNVSYLSAEYAILGANLDLS